MLRISSIKKVSNPPVPDGYVRAGKSRLHFIFFKSKGLPAPRRPVRFDSAKCSLDGSLLPVPANPKICGENKMRPKNFLFYYQSNAKLFSLILGKSLP
jgi:hypothetical protein